MNSSNRNDKESVLGILFSSSYNRKTQAEEIAGQGNLKSLTRLGASAVRSSISIHWPAELINSNFPRKVDRESGLSPANSAANIARHVDVIGGNDWEACDLVCVKRLIPCVDHIVIVCNPVECLDRVGKPRCSSLRFQLYLSLIHI